MQIKLNEKVFKYYPPPIIISFQVHNFIAANLDLMFQAIPLSSHISNYLLVFIFN